MAEPTTSPAKPIAFAPVTVDTPATWRRPASLGFVDEIGPVALSDSELLLSSHHLPIAIDHIGGRLEVVAMTTPQFQRTPLIGKDGQWQRGYVPIVLRCLPFRLTVNDAGAETLEMAAAIQPNDGPEIALRDPDGAFSGEIRRIVGLLRRLEAGRQALRAAAAKLLIADVLVPFRLANLPGSSSTHSRALTVDHNRFAALSGRRAAHLAREDFLAIDLASACLFSQRLMPGPISVASEPKTATAARNAISDDTILDFRPSAQLDDSELFSFELFSKTR
jgi:hypothetical protein